MNCPKCGRALVGPRVNSSSLDEFMYCPGWPNLCSGFSLTVERAENPYNPQKQTTVRCSNCNDFLIVLDNKLACPNWRSDGSGCEGTIVSMRDAQLSMF